MRSLAALIFFCLTACRLFEYSEIVVELPEPPPFWPDRLTSCRYAVRYLQSDGTVGEVEIEPGVSRVLLRIPKLPVVPVVAAPICGRPPAVVRAGGAVYPAHLHDDGVLRLTWENGFLAEVLISCAGSGDSLQAVNAQKISSAILERSSGNPWRLDADRLKSAITGGTLTYRSLRILPCSDVALEAAPGRWINGNPLAPGPVDCTKGFLMLPELPEGLHSFLQVDGHGRIDISVFSDGWTAVRPFTGAGSSGNW